MFGLGYMELLVVGGIMLLLFGKRLPEVARSMGKGITEFKKGVQGIEDDVSTSSHTHYSAPTADRPMADEDLENVTAPKFEPPSAADESENEVEAATDSSEKEEQAGSSGT